MTKSSIIRPTTHAPFDSINIRITLISVCFIQILLAMAKMNCLPWECPRPDWSWPGSRRHPGGRSLRTGRSGRIISIRLPQEWTRFCFFFTSWEISRPAWKAKTCIHTHIYTVTYILIKLQFLTSLPLWQPHISSLHCRKENEKKKASESLETESFRVRLSEELHSRSPFGWRWWSSTSRR